VSASQNFPLSERCGVITGAVGGIGSSLCDAFSEAGARVAVLDLDETRASEKAGQLRGDAIGIGVDISNEHQVKEGFDRITAEFGRLDFLVNNAGVRYEESFLDHQLDSWRKTLDINLTGAFLCARAAARWMVDHGGGKIVNIASIAGASAVSGRAAYVSSKAGLIGLTRAIAWELGEHGIYCNALLPGVIETPLTAHYFDDPDLVQKITRATSLPRVGEPGDIAGPAVFLCSSASDYIQGALLPVDGGWLAGKGY